MKIRIMRNAKTPTLVLYFSYTNIDLIIFIDIYNFNLSVFSRETSCI